MRAKKNVDLDRNKLIEISSEEVYNSIPSRISINSELVNVEDVGKNLGVLKYASALGLNFERPLPMAPWNLSFSAVIPDSVSTFSFEVNPVSRIRVEMLWNVDGLTFAFYNLGGEIEGAYSVSGFSWEEILHVSIEYVDSKIWVNGTKRVTLRWVANVQLSSASLRIPKLGILSFYDRNLSKDEIVQHFIDYHVANFTNDEVLI